MAIKDLAYYTARSQSGSAYATRIVRGLNNGLTVSQARGHAAIGLPSVNVIKQSKKVHGWIARDIIKASTIADTPELKQKINKLNKLLEQSFQYNEKSYKVKDEQQFRNLIDELREEPDAHIQFGYGETPKA